MIFYLSTMVNYLVYHWTSTPTMIYSPNDVQFKVVCFHQNCIIAASEDALYLLRNGSFTNILGLQGVTKIIPVFKSLFLVTNSSLSILANIYELVTFSKHVLNVWDVIDNSFIDMIEPIQKLSEYLNSSNEWIKQSIKYCGVVDGTVGGFPDITLSSITTMVDSFKKLKETLSKYDIDLNLVMTKFISTIELEHHFSKMRTGSDKVPSYSNAIRRIYNIAKVQSVQFRLRNKKEATNANSKKGEEREREQVHLHRYNNLRGLLKRQG